MADVTEQRIFCAEQIVVPQDLPAILKHYSKEVIRHNPQNIIEFSAQFLIKFEYLLEKRKSGEGKNEFSELEKPDSKQALK